MPKIEIRENQKEKKIYECSRGQNLYQFLAANDLMDAPCGGVGICGKCKIKILHAGLGVCSGEEQFFTESQLNAGWRLACLHTVEDDILIELPIAEKPCEIVSKGYLRPFQRQPGIRKELDEKGDTGVWAEGTLLCKEPGDTRDKLYGIAVDIGTTTMVASLVDMHNGKECYSMCCINGQKSFGQDVISRIQYASTQPNGTEILQKTVRNDLRNLIDTLLAEAAKGLPVTAADVYEITVGANSTMIHLLAGIDPTSMGQAPYLPAFEGSLTLSAKELVLPGAEVCRVYCLPAVSAFVGGDIIAGILACGIHQTKQTVLFIDIGTNGEMALAKDGKLCACSCAAGPALEGMNIGCGVRAAAGAIEDVAILTGHGESQVALTVIDGQAPTGLCGSGLLAAVAEMRRVGILHPSGRLLEHPLVEKLDGQKRFVLDRAHNIYLTQRDIRQVQLAKGAILSGIRAMLQCNRMVEDDIEEVVVAGQFGAHLKAASLTGAGLIPRGLEQRITYVGNTSKAGAYLCLLAAPERKVAERLAQTIEYIELSQLEGYEGLYVNAMCFD